MSLLRQRVLAGRGSEDSSPWRKALASLAAMLVALMGVVALPTVASAAPNESIIVDSIQIGEGTGEGGQLVIGDTVAITGTWNAEEAKPEPGDTFTVGLPVEFHFPQDLPINLTGPNGNGDIVTWATCSISSETDDMVCTLTDAVASWSEGVQGTFEFEIEVVAATTEDEVVFNLNGKDTPVELPGEGGIDDGIEVPDEFTKAGVMNSNNWSLTWTVELPGSRMAGEDVLYVRDTLGDNHQLCEPAAITVQTVYGDTVVDVSEIAEIVPIEGTNDFTIVLTAPEDGFDPNVTYRLTYETCTIDNQIDPEGTEYTNEATVDIWGGGTGIIGVPNKPWQGNLWKGGTVQGGEARNGEIVWTVVVPGSVLFDKDGFNFSEVLGEGHEVTDETISSIRIVEQYGPSGDIRTNITGQLVADVESQTADGFSINYTIAEGSELEFKQSDWRYIITYTTYVIEEGLPDGRTVYSNSASIDGAVTTGTGTVPARNEGKGGSINTTAQTIDGYEHLPQSTLNWLVRIPGQKIEDIDSPLVLTDTIAGPHGVCEPGPNAGGLKAQLALNVTAQDQISGGGLTTVDLTESVEVDINEDGEIVFTIPQPTLPTPAGGEATGFSPEYQYLISYKTCTTSGGMDQQGTEYGNSITGEGVSYTQSATQNNRGSGTGTGVARGSIDIAKFLDLDAPGAEFVPEDAVFTVHVQEINPDGDVEIEYDLRVPLNGDPAQGLNSRGHGWTAIITEPTFPNIPGVTFGAPSFAETEGVVVSEDGQTATATLTPGANIGVEVTNTTKLGSVSITKDVTGGAAWFPSPTKEYEVTAQIDTSGLGDLVPAWPDQVFAVRDGETFTIDNLPIGAVVTFTEAELVSNDFITWDPPVFSPESITITADHADEPAAVLLTNNVERAVGTFSISKTVVGDQADNPAVPDTVTVLASWNEEGTPGETTLEIPTDGTPVPLGEDLLIFTQVTLTEVPLEDGSSISWGESSWSGQNLVVGDDGSAVVTVTRDGDVTINLENVANTSTASFELIKSVEGEAAGEVASDAVYPVTATWVDSEGVEQSKTFDINAVEATPLGVDLPAGTVVTLSEGDAPEFSTVDWGSITLAGEGVTDNGDGTATIVISDQQDDVTLVTITNEANWAASNFELSKAVADTPGAEFVPDGTFFTVQVQEFDPEGVTGEQYELEVPLNGDPVVGSNSFGPGWTAVLTEPTFPEVAGVTFGDPVFAPSENVTVSEDGTSATVTYVPGETATVSLTNEALLGEISIVKELAGGAAEVVPADKTFEVTAHIDTTALGEDFPAQEDRTITLTVGEPVIIDDLPIGAVVTFTETALVDDDILTWGEAVFSPESVTVTAENANEPAVVTLTNNVERTVGTFSISKIVTGEQADNPAVPATVTVTATWDEEGTPGETTLEIPTDGTPVDFGFDLLIGTEVTLTELTLEDGSSIAWGAPTWSGDGVVIDDNSAIVTISRNADAAVQLENHAATSVAGISILKAIAGEAAEEVSPETEFPVTVTWTDAEGAEQSRELMINAVEPTPLGEDLPAGTVVTITEGERPGFDTVIWDAIVISGDDVTDNGDGSADVIVSDQQGDVTLVTVTNEATWAPGTFTLLKNVTGVLLENADVPETVNVVASWVEQVEDGVDEETGEPIEGGLVTVSRVIEIPTDGTPVALGEDLPHGTEVTLVEDPLAGNPAFTWDAPVWGEVEGLVINEDGSATLTIGAAQNPTVELTNNATATLGSLVVSKDVSGSGGNLLPANTVYPVTATWTDLLGVEQVVELELVAGTPATIDNLPLGTEVTLTEGEFNVPATVTFEGATWSGTSDNVVVTADGQTAVITVDGEAGAEASVTLDNEFNEIPAKPDKPGKPDLPWTGADARQLGAMALMLVAGGLAVLYVVRRKNA